MTQAMRSRMCTLTPSRFIWGVLYLKPAKIKAYREGCSIADALKLVVVVVVLLLLLHRLAIPVANHG